MKNSFSSLSTKDLATLGQRTISMSEDPAFAVVKDNPLLATLKTVYNDYDAVYTKKSYSGKSAQLLEADSKRDVCFSSLKDILRGHAKLSASPYQQDAQDIYAIIVQHGIDLDRYKYSEETAQLKKLIEEFDKPANAAKIERMNLTAVVQQLKAAQIDFENMFDELSGENSELRLMESASSIRKTLEVALRNYYNLVKAMNQLSGWRELHAKLEQAVKAACDSRQNTPKTDGNTSAS